MYKYEYETVEYDLGGWRFGSGNVYCITEDYRSIIKKGRQTVGDMQDIFLQNSVVRDIYRKST